MFEIESTNVDKILCGIDSMFEIKKTKIQYQRANPKISIKWTKTHNETSFKIDKRDNYFLLNFSIVLADK